MPQHPYVAVVEQRADAYAAHVATMTLSPEIQQWAADMTAQHGPKVGLHNVGKICSIDNQIVDLRAYAYDWITALLVVRYGEEPDASKTGDGIGWPTLFTEADYVRALKWLDGDHPKGATYSPES